MLKAIYAIATAVIIAAGIVAFPSIFLPDGRNTKVSTGDCQQKAWPYNQMPCSDQQSPSATARAVRVIPARSTK